MDREEGERGRKTPSKAGKTSSRRGPAGLAPIKTFFLRSPRTFPERNNPER
jgi:hypothetical protein